MSRRRGWQAESYIASEIAAFPPLPAREGIEGWVASEASRLRGSPTPAPSLAGRGELCRRVVLVGGRLWWGELGHWARGGFDHRRLGQLLGAAGAERLEPARLGEHLAFEAADHLVVGGVGSREVLADPLHMLSH